MRNGMPVFRLFYPWAFYLLTGLSFLGGGVAATLSESRWVLIYFPLGALLTLIGLLGGLGPMRVLLGRKSDIVGSVSSKTVKKPQPFGDGLIEFNYIEVGGLPFDVSYTIFDWVDEGDEVSIIYWRRNRGVVSVEKTGNRTSPLEEAQLEEAQPPSEEAQSSPDDKPQSSPEEEPSLGNQPLINCSEHPDLSPEADERLHARRLAQQGGAVNAGSASYEGGLAARPETDDIEAEEVNGPEAAKIEHT